MTVCEPHVDEDHLPALLEGFLEMYFKNANSPLLEWLFHLANQSSKSYLEIQLFMKHVPKNVVKYFLRNQMFKHKKEQADSKYCNILQLYDSEV